MRNNRGFTLVELMVTVTIMSLVLLMVVSFYRSGMFAYTRYNERQERISQWDRALESISTELAAAARVDFVEPYRLGFTERDRDEDGYRIPGELVIYEWRGDQNRSLIRIRSGVETVVLPRIETLEFTGMVDQGLLRITIKPEGLARLECIFRATSPHDSDLLHPRVPICFAPSFRFASPPPKLT